MRGYRLELWIPDRYSGWSLARVERRRTRERAERRAESMLRKHETGVTRYQRSPRLPFVSIRGRELTLVENIEAPTLLVPSVGELGWTP